MESWYRQRAYDIVSRRAWQLMGASLKNRLTEAVPDRRPKAVRNQEAGAAERTRTTDLLITKRGRPTTDANVHPRAPINARKRATRLLSDLGWQ